MKKTLLTLAIMLLGFSAAKAENIVEDWTTAKSWASVTWEAKDTEAKSFTSTETSIKYDFYWANAGSGYLFMDAKKANTNTKKKAYVSFSLPIDCAEIVLTMSSGCSENKNNTVNVYAGDEKIASGVAVNVRGADAKVTIPAAYRAKGTVYKVESNTTSYNQQFTKFTYVEPTSDPVLSIAKADAKFATPLNGTQTVTISGNAENLAENISVSVDNAAFSLSSSSLTAAELTDGVEVTYTGSEVGEKTATLTFKSGDLTQTVALSALTVANEGTESNPLTVADVLAMNSVNSGPFYITGTIGDKTAANATDGMVTEAGSNVNTNIILKDAEGKMIGVAISGDARTQLNIVDNPSNVGKTVIVKGTLEAYYGAPGVKNAEYISGLTSSGIADIVADENAPVEYFNLQGIRVDNPENGLYIRRQGNKVTKVIVK